MEARNIANPTIRTASGEAEPVKPTSRARVKATLLDGATLAIETTKSPHRVTAFAFRPTGSCDSLTETTAVPPPTLARTSDRQIGYVSTIVKSRQVGVKVGYEWLGVVPVRRERRRGVAVTTWLWQPCRWVVRGRRGRW